MKIERKEGEFSISLEKEKAVLLYRIVGKTMIIYHTYTPPEFRGKGIAGNLVKNAIEFAKQKGLKIKPACSYAEYYFEKNPENKKMLAD